LKNSALRDPEAYALAFNGTRVQRLPISREGDSLKLSFDTAAFEKGPSPFVEIVSGKGSETK